METSGQVSAGCIVWHGTYNVDKDRDHTDTPPCQIRKRVPELEPFVNNWGAKYLVQETFNHRRSHRLFTHRQRDDAEQRAEADEEAEALAKAEDKAARAARRKGMTSH